MADDGGDPSESLGFFGQLRSQHWAVKIILGFVLLIVGSPFLGIGAGLAYSVARGPGLLVYGALILFGYGWFVFTRPQVPDLVRDLSSTAARPAPAAAAPVPAPQDSFAAAGAATVSRYCQTCGAGFGSELNRCHECGADWQDTPAGSIGTLAAYLNQLTRDRLFGLLDEPNFRRLRSEYERRLSALRPTPTPPEPVTAVPAPVIPPPPVPVERPASAIPTPVTPRPARVREPRPTAADMGRTVIGWAAERQADILLYVGAFMLSIAAIIFVAYQGEELSGAIRFTVLTAYAVGFLGFGLLLHRWERVKEAGPAFLALGAILVPLDFVALRTQVLSHQQLADDVLWLIASSSCAALYFVLAFRGYGRFYFLPAIPATLIAWGSLGSVVNLPAEWFGPWYLGIAAPGYVTAIAFLGRWGPAKWLLGLAVVIGGAALGWTHVVSAASGDHHAAVPAAYALGTAAVATGLRWRRDVPALSVLPILAGLTAGSAWWAAFGLSYEWQPVFVALTGAGYLVLAHFQPRELAQGWAGIATGFAALALVAAHVAVTGDGAGHGALPATYAVVFAATAGAFGRWGWGAAGAALPPLGAMTLLTAAWASGAAGTEWYGAFAVLAAFGYLALAAFDRQERTLNWQTAAAFTAVIGPPLAHIAVAANDDPQRWALPATHGMVLVGAAAAFARWRWSWRVAPAAIPAAAALTALTASWARWDLQPEWYAAFAAAAGLGYLVLAHFGEQRLARSWGAVAFAFGALAVTGAHIAILEPGAERLALPLAYGLFLVGVAAAYARWRWLESAALLPPAAAMTALTAAWWRWDLQPEWYASFAAAAAIGYLALARFDFAERRAYWWGGSVLAAGTALAMAHVAVAVRLEPDRLALPVPYAVLTGGAAAAFTAWRFRWRVAPGALPALAAMTAITGAWALWDIQFAWYGPIAAAATFGYIAWALTDEVPRARPWLAFAAVAGGVGVIFTQAAQFAEADPAPVHAALPVVYGQAAVAAAFAAGRWRWACREAVALVPPLAAAFGASLLWATIDMRTEWLTAWAAAAAAGYLVPALLDARFRVSWQTASAFCGVGVLVVAHALATADDPVRWQLPASYAILLAGWTVLAAWLRDRSALAPPVLAAMLGGTALWAAGVDQQWWPYPALGVAALIMATARWWPPNRVFGMAGWGYAVALAVVPAIAVLPVDYTHHAHGVAVQLAAAALLGIAALASRGSIFALFVDRPTERAKSAEWTMLTQASFAFLFGAGASLNGVLELAGADRAWAFAILGMVGWVLTASRWGGVAGMWTFAPAGLAGAAVSSLVAAEAGEAAYGTLTGVLALATIGPVAAYAGARRWTLLGIANSFLFLAIWAAWRWQDLDLAYLPLAFAAVATLEWTALIALRRYEGTPSESNVVIGYISWAPWLLSAAVSGILLSREQVSLEPGATLVTTEEWGLAATVLGLLAAAVTAEGIRLKRRWVWIMGSAGLLGSLLMAIATREPGNIQAFTAPAGIYLIAIALTFRRSAPFIREHMHVHEAVMVLGALLLVLPPAEQSFEPGGGKFGLELIGIGIGLLAVGLLLHGRWLVAAAILTLTATSARMVTGGLFTTPYWLLLGIGGTALIGFGLLVLLERERWDRFRHAVVRWWTAVEEAPVEPLGGPRPPEGQRP